MAYKIRPRAGSAAEWTAANPVLAEREIGYEFPTDGLGAGYVKMKMGDGVTHWNDLPYASEIVPISNGLVQDAVDNWFDTHGDLLIPDGAITEPKLASALATKINNKADASALESEVSTRATEIAVERARIDSIVALPDGSTTADAELTDIRVAYDGKTYASAGDAVRGQVETVLNDLNDVAYLKKSVNRFDVNDITLNYVLDGSGQPQSNNDAFISNYIACEPSSVIRYYRLTNTDTFQTNTIMYLCQYDQYKGFISRTTYANGAGDTTLDSTCHYVRFAQPKTQLTDKVIAVTFDVKLSKDTIATFSDKFVLRQSDEIETASASFEEIKTINRLNLNTITKKTVVNSDGSLIANNDAFTSDYIECEPSAVIRFYRLLSNGNVQSNTILYLGQYDQYKGFISRTTYANGTGDTTLDASCHYVRISAGLNLLDDQVVAVTFDTTVTRATLSPAYGGVGLRDVANVPFKLKVMTYNIGRYSYGVSPYYLNTDYDTKVANYKKFFAEQKCDVIGIQENNIYLDALSSGSVTANSLYSYLYPWFADEGNGVSLKSKFPMYNQGTGTFTASSRTYVYGTLDVNGREIFIMSVHLTPNAGESQDTLRAQERAEILSIVADKEYFIVFGDYNAQSTSDYDDFVNAGCHIANGGYLPFEWTYSYTPEDFSAETPSANIRYLDNIVTSKNIIIDFSERLNVYADLSSDHIPFVAHLTIN